MHTGIKVSLLLLFFSGFLNAGDNLLCFEITSSSETVFSAPLSVPENTSVNIEFKTTNTDSSAAFNQGVLIEFPFGKVVRYQAPYPYTGMTSTPWSNRELPEAAIAQVANLNFDPYTIRGPCTISFFCKKASLLGSLYLKTDYKYNNYFTTKIFKPSEQSFTFNIPSQNLGVCETCSYGTQAVNQKYTSGSGIEYPNSITLNPYTGFISDPPKIYVSLNSGDYPSIPSSVVPWASINYNQNYRQVQPTLCGPANIKFEYTNTSDTSSFTIIRYYLSPANFGFNSNQTVVGTSNSPSNQTSVNLVIERSTDLKNWSSIDTLYVSEVAGKSFYRIRVIAN